MSSWPLCDVLLARADEHGWRRKGALTHLLILELDERLRFPPGCVGVRKDNAASLIICVSSGKEEKKGKEKKDKKKNGKVKKRNVLTKPKVKWILAGAADTLSKPIAESQSSPPSSAAFFKLSFQASPPEFPAATKRAIFRAATAACAMPGRAAFCAPESAMSPTAKRWGEARV